MILLSARRLGLLMHTVFPRLNTLSSLAYKSKGQ